MKTKWKNKAVLWIVIFMLSFGPTAAFAENKAAAAKSNLDQVYELIQTYHVSGIEGKKLEQAAIEGMIKALNDPYTQYMSKEEWEKFQNSLSNNYFGIGARVGQDESGVFLMEVFPNSPAFRAGLQRGDYLVTVAGSPVQGKSLNAIVSQIIGPENSTVSITVNRSGQELEKQVVRQKIQLPVLTAKMFDKGIGYIRLSSFSDDADELFVNELNKMKKSGLRSLIIDLRDNPGGVLQTAAQIAGQFMQEGVLIRMKDRSGINQAYKIAGGIDANFPIITLVNEGSASASEVLTGALRDYSLSTVIGTKTYGKGSVQDVIPLSDGAVLKLTTEEYMTPQSRPVNKVGLKPDIEVEGDIPQLIRSLYWAGLKELKLSIGKYSYELNGFEVSDLVQVIRDQDRVYVPIRIAAAMMDWNVGWNEETKSVELTRQYEKKTIPVTSEGVKMKDGTTYIDLAAFQRIYPKLQWTADNDRVTINGKSEEYK